MFSPQRVAEYLSNAFVRLAPVLGAILALSLITELSVREGDWADLMASWQFWLALARDMAPSLVALFAVYLLAARFVGGLHGIENSKARGWVNHCVFGLWGFHPWLRVAAGIAEGGEEHILKRVGGPGHLVVYNDNAVLLERGGRFTRIECQEFPRLEPLEKIYHVVDLRPKRWVYEVSAISKEGIPITCEAEIRYQIDNQGLQPSKETPFPAPEETIFRAATCTWIREANRPEETRTMDWSGRVIISETEGSLRTILAQQPLDWLIGLLSPDAENPREEIRQELEKRLKAAVPKLGVRILGVALGDIKVKDEITQQWIEAWRAQWAAWATERQAFGRAKQIAQMEEAKTVAQIMMIQAIIGAFRPMAAQDQAMSSKLILARLFMVLGRASSEAWAQVFLPPEALNALKLLREMTK